MPDDTGASQAAADWFIATDAGRLLSRRPRQRNDCTVRALVSACGVPYDDAYDLLSEAGRKSGKGFEFRSWADRSGSCGGFRFVWIPFQAVRGERRMDPARFAVSHPHGRYVLKTAKHVIACVDGKVHDEERPRAGRCVYGAWELVTVR